MTQVLRGCLWAAIIVIGLFFLAFMPEWGHNRRYARRTSCLSNMKSLAIATLSYTEDWDGRLPPAPRTPVALGLEAGILRTGPSDLAQYFPADDWHRQIHYRNDEVFVCPSTRSIYSYDFSPQLYGVNVARVKEPEMTVMEFEKGYLTGSPPGPHIKGYNTTYCDGRAAWVSHAYQQNGDILLH
jgi:hypothetical protein